MKYVANAHVHDTGARLTQAVEATTARKAAELAQDWSHENDLVFDGIETLAEHEARVSATRPSVRRRS